jgi:hypothetical protein
VVINVLHGGAFDVHPKLIKANIALYNGARSETRRLLEEYRAEAKAEKPAPMVLWLDAQAQDEHTDRVARLHTLIEETGESSRYARQAQEYIETESQYTDKPLPGSRGSRRAVSLGGVALWKAGLFLVVGALAGIVIFSAFNPGNAAVTSPTEGTQTANSISPGDVTLGAVAETPLNLPDQSTPVAPERFQAQYPQGVLQITAIEDSSQRAADIRQRVIVTPITGARFYALKLIFECRAGICANPPQAQLSVELNDGVTIPVMDNVGINGERLFQPVAQGRSTTGWVVFEIPETNRPVRLVITPAATSASETPQPAFIDLAAE